MTRTALLLLALASCGPTDVEAPPLPGQPAQPKEPPVQQPELTGLPCDVRAAMQSACASCHTAAVYVPRFRTRADLLQLAPQVAERLQSATNPMPPAAAARQMTTDERALITRWVDDGMPAGECGDLQ